MSAPGGSAFMHELLGVVAEEVRGLGQATSIDDVTVSEGPFPTLGGDELYVVVPHEYFVVIPPHERPSPEQMRRTIGFCVEHPGTAEFETTVRFARELGACVDINDDSTSALNAQGIPAQRFVLGYSRAWDRWHGQASPRPLDVAYLGTTDDRRSRYLALEFEVLDDEEILFAMPPHEPMIRPRPDFFMGEEKLQLLASTKVLLNLHRGGSRSLEWVRVLEAMSNGCVVVSEHSADIAPLRPGRDLLLTSPEVIMHVARTVLRSPSRLEEIRETSYGLLREELTMRSGAAVLAELAGDLAAGRPPQPRRAGPARRSQPLETSLAGTVTVLEPSGDRGAGDPWTGGGAELSPAAVSPGGSGSVALECDPRWLDVVVLQRPGTPIPIPMLESLLPQLDGIDAAVHLGAGAGHFNAWPDDARIIAHDPEVLEDEHALAAMVIGASGAELILLLESTDQLSRHALARLIAALEGDEVASAAYGMVVDSRGLFVSALPFEVDRINRQSYLAAASLWRRSALVGLGGWLDRPVSIDEAAWELWRRLAAAEGSAVMVPRPLFRQLPLWSPSQRSSSDEPNLLGQKVEAN